MEPPVTRQRTAPTDHTHHHTSHLGAHHSSSRSAQTSSRTAQTSTSASRISSASPPNGRTGVESSSTNPFYVNHASSSTSPSSVEPQPPSRQVINGNANHQLP